VHPPAIPDYTLLRPIGRGAYGEVWLARNVMGTLRAVKIIWRRQFESERPFEREFIGIQRYEPVSLASGGLVHVLHVGRNDTDGYFYYVMELADSSQEEGNAPRSPSIRTGEKPISNPQGGIDCYGPRTLRSDLKRRGSLPVADSIRLAVDVISGLGQLHRHGLVHRDVKPGNIIYVNDRAKLADIGLVTADGEGQTFVGTEGYIPPEGPGTPAADLYALGMVLYETSTGLPPDRFPDVPPDWITTPAGDEALELHEVILKACEGQRERRYRSAEEMQADLALLQNGESVRHVRALKRRYTRLRGALVVGTSLLLCALAAAFFANYRARVAAESRAKETSLREEAQRALQRTEAAEHEARQQLYSALLAQARATVRSGELGQRVNALDAVRRAGAVSNTADLRGAALAAMALPDLRFERQFSRPPEVTLVQFDPAFERIALCRGSGRVEIRAVRDERLLTALPASTNLPAFLASWSSDGRFLAVKRDHDSTGEAAELEVWIVRESKLVLRLPDVRLDALRFHPHLPRIMVGLRGGAVAVWDLETAKEIDRFELGEQPRMFSFSPDGERFAVNYENDTDGAVSVQDARNGKRLLFRRFPAYVSAIDWHPTGHWIALADHEGFVRLMDPETGESRVLGRHKVQAVMVLFSPDGDYLLSGGWERELICWDLRPMERAFTIALGSFRAQFRADGRECATITDRDIRLHSFEVPTVCRELGYDLGTRLQYVAFSKDNRLLAASASQRMGVWDLTSGAPGSFIAEGVDARLFFTTNGELLASWDEAYAGWQVMSATNGGGSVQLEPLPLPKAGASPSLCLASNQVIITGEQGSRLLPPARSDAPIPKWIPTSYGISKASPDGKWLAIFQPYGRLLNLYRLPAIELVATLTNHASISAVEFSPRGDEVAVASYRGVDLWECETWKRRRHLSDFIGLLYAPRSGTLWLAKDFRTAGLYDAHTLQPLLPLPSGTLPLAVSPNGRYLAVSVDARRLQVWDLVEARARLRELGLDWGE